MMLRLRPEFELSRVLSLGGSGAFVGYGMSEVNRVGAGLYIYAMAAAQIYIVLRVIIVHAGTNN